MRDKNYPNHSTTFNNNLNYNIKYKSKKQLKQKLQEQNEYLERQIKILIQLNKVYTEMTVDALKLMIKQNQYNINEDEDTDI